MSELDMIAAVRDFSFWLIFAFLYLRERQRVQQLSDERVFFSHLDREKCC